MVGLFKPALLRSASTRRMAVCRRISDFTPASPINSSSSASHSSTVFSGSAGSASPTAGVSVGDGATAAESGCWMPACGVLS